MPALCDKYLNLIYKKKSSNKNLPFGFTEAKVSMALYKRWKELTKAGGHCKPISPIVDEDLEEQIDIDDKIEMTGLELKLLIKDLT